MKTKNLFSALSLIVVLGLSSCKDYETVDYLVTFEDVDLMEAGYWNGSDLSGKAEKEILFNKEVTNYYGSFKSGMAQFHNSYIIEWNSWTGFACSNHTDAETPGDINMYSVFAGSGANNSKQFAAAYDNNAAFTCPPDKDGYYQIKSMMLANSTYAYLYMADEVNGFSDGDFFKVVITGYKGNLQTGSVDHYLADLRDGKNYISDKWKKVDLSSLGEVDKVVFTFDSSDKKGEWLNNPAFVCVDDIHLIQRVEKN